MKKQKQLTLFVLFLFVIIYITCVSRTRSFSRQYIVYPFWELIKALNGDWNMLLLIIENIMLFIPLGFLLVQLGVGCKETVIWGFFLSILIELAQLFFHLGLFEIDDIVNNTAGTLFGAILYKRLRLSEKKKILTSGIVVVCSIIFCFTIPKTETQSYVRDFFFEIENVQVENEKIILKGDCFLYKKPDEEYGLVLKSDKEEVTVQVYTGMNSEKINSYYRCEKDFSKVGFWAFANIDIDRNYEILVKWESGIITTTNTYIKNGKIAYTTDSAPDYLGTLLVSRPEYGFYVYQDQGNLYWLCDNNFPFEDDGTTYVQYQLWTTQIENLPESRVENEWFWDNLGFIFEDFEIEKYKDFRVAKKSIPTEYAITAILTGYYKDETWRWKDYFRPIVFDLPGI